MLEHTGIRPDSPDGQSHKDSNRPEKVIYPEVVVLLHLSPKDSQDHPQTHQAQDKGKNKSKQTALRVQGHPRSYLGTDHRYDTKRERQMGVKVS
jgi:hypothetical protein